MSDTCCISCHSLPADCSATATRCGDLGPTWQLCDCASTPSCLQTPDENTCCPTDTHSCGCIDLKLNECGNDLCGLNAVTSHVLVAAMGRAAITDDDLLTGRCAQPKCSDRGGWWFTAFREEKRWGSLAWTMDGQTLTNQTRLEFEQHIADAQAVNVDAGLIAEPDITATMDDCRGTICVRDIQIVPPEALDKNGECAWQTQESA